MVIANSFIHLQNATAVTQRRPTVAQQEAWHCHHHHRRRPSSSPTSPSACASTHPCHSLFSSLVAFPNLEHFQYRPWRDRRLVSYCVPSLSSSLWLSLRLPCHVPPPLPAWHLQLLYANHRSSSRFEPAARCRRQIPHPSAEVEVHARAAPLELAGALIGGVRKFCGFLSPDHSATPALSIASSSSSRSSSSL